MSLSITEYPKTTINGHVSKWSAVQHPISFKLQRKDQQATMKYKPSGLTVRLKTVGNVPAVVTAGQTVKYIAASGYVYTWTIVSITGNTIVTDGTEAGTIYGGSVIYPDAYENYYVKSEVLAVDDSNTWVTVGYIDSKPDVNGAVTVTVSKWLKTRAVNYYKNNFAYNAINRAMSGEGGRFSIRFYEEYNGVAQASYLYSTVFYWANTTKQVLDNYGYNMADYVPTLDDTRESRAKFLTAFDKPTYWPGYPFSLSFIYSDNLKNFTITREEERFNKNGTSLSTLSSGLNMSQRFSVNRLMLAGSYANTVDTLQVWLNSGAAAEINTVENSSPVTGGVYSNGSIFSPVQPVEAAPRTYFLYP